MLSMVAFQAIVVACVLALRTPSATWLAALLAFWPANIYFWQYRFDLAPTAFLVAHAFDVYVPFAQSPDRIETFVVRTVGASDAAVPTIRERLQTPSGGALVSIEAMADVVSAHEAPWTANLALFAAFALLTVLIAVTGLYAMMAHTIVEQSREIGVRLVLGATPGGVAAGVITSALSVVVTGGLIGLGGAAAASRLMRSLLFGIDPLDPAALVAAPLVLAAVALAACVVPAIRAARTDPAVCLRAE